MKKSEVRIGGTYIVKVSDRLVTVEILSDCPYRGWNGRNLKTGRDVRVRSAARLRSEARPTHNE